jgi:hypothetical protein
MILFTFVSVLLPWQSLRSRFIGKSARGAQRGGIIDFHFFADLVSLSDGKSYQITLKNIFIL